MSKAHWIAGALGVAASVLAPALPTGQAQAATVTAPGCTTAVAPGGTLAVSPHFTSVPGSPFDVVTTPDARFTFVSSENATSGGGEIVVYAGDASSGRPVATVSLGNEIPAGMALANHARVLLVAANAELVVIDVAQAERGAPGAVVAQALGSGSGAIEVAPTPDGKFALVSMEDSMLVDVFRLAGEQRPRYVGAARVEALPVGIAFSPDGRTAYVTSEEPRNGDPKQPGTLTLLGVAAAERHPASAVEHTVAAGCAPVRVVVAPGGTVWVTARESDAVLGFSARDLALGAPALVADVRVGAAPVGMALFDGDQRMLVADSNRFAQGASSLAVLDLTGNPALVGYAPAHGFPRQMTVEPNKQEILITNYASGQLETVPVAPLVAAPR